jgi:hypothetical protein
MCHRNERDYGTTVVTRRSEVLFEVVDSICNASHHSVDVSVCLFGCNPAHVCDFVGLLNHLLDHLEHPRAEPIRFPQLTGDRPGCRPFRFQLIDLCVSDGAPGIDCFLRQSALISDSLCVLFCRVLSTDRMLLRELVEHLLSTVDRKSVV